MTILLVAGGAMACNGTALADCLGNEPVAAAKAFYQKHVDFYYADPSKFQDVITPALLKRLAKNFDCSDGQVCALDSDPWVDAQDGDIADPITYELGDHTADQATVIMHYVFTLSGNPSQPQQVRLKLQRADQCWRVDDMITPTGNSLVKEIDDWFNEYGSSLTPPSNP